MEIGPLKEGFAVQMPQPKNEVIPRLPCRGLVLAPSNSGKTNAVVTMLTDPRFYKGMFTRVYWCSPTASVDPALDPLRRYVETLQDQKEDATFHDTVDVPFLQSRVDRAKKVMETLKTRRIEQKGFHTMIVIDDLADVKRGLPQIARFVDSLFVKGRHFGVSCILCTQKLKLPLISPTVRVNCTFIMAFRLRAWHDLWDGLIQEYSAIVSKEQLYEMYLDSVREPFSFLYINLLAKTADEMFFKRFTHQYEVDDDEKIVEPSE
jgi:hypothetical protein